MYVFRARNESGPDYSITRRRSRRDNEGHPWHFLLVLQTLRQRDLVGALAGPSIRGLSTAYLTAFDAKSLYTAMMLCS